MKIPPTVAVTPPRPIVRRTVAVIVKRGQQVLVERIAAHLRVVREPGKPPYVKVADEGEV